MRQFVTTLLYVASLQLSTAAFGFRTDARVHSSLFMAAIDGSKGDKTENTKPKAEYGVSYIGGDPCGSKYNDDPFDVQVQKPGMPDDMKARIQALVDQKVAEEQAEKEAKEE